jgi:DNA helicase-2/ATP-dependent DNA helicase PcrA
MAEKGEAGLEEERRLAYVGLTRARERSIITFAANRRVHNQWQSSSPSRFIEELPAEHVEKVRLGNQTHAFIRQATPPKLEAQESASLSLRKEEFHEGQRIFHLKFGYGTIMTVEGDKLEIDFDHTGLKMVMKNFVKSAE